jgi:phosphomannomutase
VLGTAAGLPALLIEIIRSTSTSTAAPTTRPTRSRPANIVDLQGRRRTCGADLGLAFDGDADRCFVVDERG